MYIAVVLAVLWLISLIKKKMSISKNNIFNEKSSVYEASEKVDNTSQTAFQTDKNEYNKKMKSSEIGFVNNKNQKNNGRSDVPGTDHLQWFYNMECLNCGHIYHSNGSNIYEKKCPKCQGGM